MVRLLRNLVTVAVFAMVAIAYAVSAVKNSEDLTAETRQRFFGHNPGEVDPFVEQHGAHS